MAATLEKAETETNFHHLPQMAFRMAETVLACRRRFGEGEPSDEQDKRYLRLATWFIIFGEQNQATTAEVRPITLQQEAQRALRLEADDKWGLQYALVSTAETLIHLNEGETPTAAEQMVAEMVLRQMHRHLQAKEMAAWLSGPPPELPGQAQLFIP